MGILNVSFCSILYGVEFQCIMLSFQDGRRNKMGNQSYLSHATPTVSSSHAHTLIMNDKDGMGECIVWKGQLRCAQTAKQRKKPAAI